MAVPNMFLCWIYFFLVIIIIFSMWSYFASFRLFSLKKKSCARKWRRRRRLCFQFNVPVYFCVCVQRGWLCIPPFTLPIRKETWPTKKNRKKNSFRFLYINMFKAKLKINRYPELYPTYLKNSGILWRRCCLCHASRPSAEFCRRRKLSIFLLPSPFPTRPPPPCNWTVAFFWGGVHISEKWLALFARGKSLLFQYHDMSVQIVWYIAQLPSMMSWQMNVKAQKWPRGSLCVTWTTKEKNTKFGQGTTGERSEEESHLSCSTVITSTATNKFVRHNPPCADTCFVPELFCQHDPPEIDALDRHW